MTREPADRAESGPGEGDDAELAALEAAAEQARADARRAAQAVRTARRARGKAAVADPIAEPVSAAGPVADAEPVAEPATVDQPAEPVALEKPTTAKATTAKATATKAPTTKASTAKATTAKATTTKAPTTKAPTTKAPVPDGAVGDDTESTDGPAADTDDAAPKARRRPRRVTVLATVFAALAAVFVVVAGVVHANAGDARQTSPAAARDAALLAARQDIVVLNTLDYTDVDGGLQRWLAATTGTLRDQLAGVSDADKQAIAVSKSVTTASVLAAAVTQVDATRGTATVIASVQIDVKPQSGEATTKRSRFSLTMTRVGDVWKLGAVQQVGVTLS